jgi:hypothetical protein
LAQQVPGVRFGRLDDAVGRGRDLIEPDALVVRDGHAVVDEVPPTMPSPPDGAELLPPPEYEVWRESRLGRWMLVAGSKSLASTIALPDYPG